MKVTVTATSTTNTATAVSSTATAVSIIPKTEVTDATLQFQSPIAAAAVTSGTLKRPVSLDLNKTIGLAKKQRLVTPSPLNIDSPNLENLKALNTPDIEKIVLASGLMQTPQPGVVFPTKGSSVTSEQEAYAKGFEEALSNLHHKAAQGGVSSNTNIATTTSVTASTTVTAGTGISGGSFTYTNLETFPVAIKDEPQQQPASPPVSPIDMETQEKIKLERKRQRNRVAASKCRKRKLERISKLEDKVKILKGENVDLGAIVKNLKDHVAQLKEQVMDHMKSGCTITMMSDGAMLPGK